MMWHDLAMNIEDRYNATKKGIKEEKEQNDGVKMRNINNEFKLEIMKTRKNMLSSHHLNKLLMDNCDFKRFQKIKICGKNTAKYFIKIS